MTVDTYVGSSSSAWGDYGDVGLEDVGAADIQMPRIQIDHEKAVFKDSTTGQEMDTLECVILGLVKQRIMWDSTVDDGDKPQCKSSDYSLGFPQMRTDIPARKQFPWAKSNFNKEDFEPNDDGQIVLPCTTCSLNKWGKDSEKPLCSEQYTFPIYYRAPDGAMRPGMLSFQRSGLKAARTYTGTFATAKQPMFTVWTMISLRPESRGKVVYAVPLFSRGGSSDASEWPGYADQYRGAREYLHQPPRPATKEADEAEAEKKASRPTPASATDATKISDDDVWATAEAASAPVASTAADDDLPF